MVVFAVQAAAGSTLTDVSREVRDKQRRQRAREQLLKLNQKRREEKVGCEGVRRKVLGCEGARGRVRSTDQDLTLGYFPPSHTHNFLSLPSSLPPLSTHTHTCTLLYPDCFL